MTDPSRLLRVIPLAVGAVATLWLWPTPAAGQNTSFTEASQLSEAIVQRWTTAEGLPQNAVISMVRSPDGYLWFGTRAGLGRFDGVRFTTYDRSNSPLQDDFVTTLAAQDSSLWVGTRSGLYRLEAGNWESLDTAKELPDRYIRSLFVDRNGRLWVGMSRAGVGFLERVDNVWRFTAIEGIPAGTARALTSWRDRLYAGMPDGLWSVTMTTADNARQDLVSASVRALFSGSSLWVGTNDGSLYRGVQASSEDRRARFSNTNLRQSAAILSLYQDPASTLWIGTNGGGLLFRAGREQPRVVPAITPRIYSMMRGTDDSYWIGTRQGVYQLRRSRATSFDREQGFPDSFVRSLWLDSDGTILTTTGHGLARFRPDTQQARPMKEDPNATALRTALRDNRGQLWVGTSEGLQLWRSARQIPQPDLPEILQASINALALDPRGRLWVGSRSGLGRFDGISWTTWTSQDGLPDDPVRAILPEDTEAWIGTEAGLARLTDDNIDAAGAESLAGDIVLSLFRDREGWLWAGSASHGLFGLRDGNSIHLDRSSGLEEDVILQIVDDDQGHLWFCGNRGIGRITRERLDQYVLDPRRPIVVDRLSERDGLPSAECNGGSQPGALNARGVLWFPTVGGLARISTDLEFPANEQPPVLIEEFVANTISYGQPHDELTLGPGRMNISLRWAAPAAHRPNDLRFRYRLPGLSDEWIVGRGNEALFLGLGPDEYTFEVQASGPSVSWTGPVQSLTFTVLPRFWQNRVLQLLAVVLALIGGAIIYRFRTWALKRNQERLEELVDQRTTELAYANRRLHLAATHDELTGLANRRRVYDRLEHEWRRATRAKTSLSVLMIDLDQFKAFNDQHGHQAGDQALCTVADVFRAILRRSTDLIGRYGGEEFIGVLANTNQVQAVDLAQTIVEAVRNLGKKNGTHITISVGVATDLPADKPDLECTTAVDELIRAADQALYRVKRAGGDDARA